MSVQKNEGKHDDYVCSHNEGNILRQKFPDFHFLERYAREAGGGNCLGTLLSLPEAEWTDLGRGLVGNEFG